MKNKFSNKDIGILEEIIDQHQTLTEFLEQITEPEPVTENDTATSKEAA